MSHETDAIHARYYAQRALEYDTSVGYGRPETDEILLPLQTWLQASLAGRDVLEVACGTGYWSKGVAKTARSLVATDRDDNSLRLASSRLDGIPNTSVRQCDAFSLAEAGIGYNAAFAMFWWSHIPRARISTFLRGLHACLMPGAVVIFSDQLPYPATRRVDAAGDTIEERHLKNGTVFEIVKNFPDADELRATVDGIANEFTYWTSPCGRLWGARYTLLA